MKKWEKYLIRNSIYLILFFALIGLTQCDFIGNLRDKNKKEVFDPYDHPLFEAGDTLVYQSETNVDSFYVSESVVYEPHTNPSDESTDITEYMGSIHQTGATVKTQICFAIYISSGAYYVDNYLCSYGRTGGEYNWVFSRVVKENGGYSYTIGAYELNDLYKTPWFQNEQSIFEGKADSVLYSKAYGIIKYWRKNQYYEITPSTLEMLMARDK